LKVFKSTSNSKKKSIGELNERIDVVEKLNKKVDGKPQMIPRLVKYLRTSTD
jgi:hypothetical protein